MEISHSDHDENDIGYELLDYDLLLSFFPELLEQDCREFRRVEACRHLCEDCRKANEGIAKIEEPAQVEYLDYHFLLHHRVFLS